jgi:hypothetical protein
MDHDEGAAEPLLISLASPPLGTRMETIGHHPVKWGSKGYFTLTA